MILCVENLLRLGAPVLEVSKQTGKEPSNDIRDSLISAAIGESLNDLPADIRSEDSCDNIWISTRFV